MKKMLIISITFILIFQNIGFSEIYFLGIPVIPNARIIKKDTKRIEFVCNISHDKILQFYKKFLKGKKDIKIREWKNATYIEDDGNRKWHSITIYRKSIQTGTLVIIKKDSWTWIIGTLILRFVGVFVVLMTLLIALSLSGKIISAIVKRMESKQEA